MLKYFRNSFEIVRFMMKQTFLRSFFLCFLCLILVVGCVSCGFIPTDDGGDTPPTVNYNAKDSSVYTLATWKSQKALMPKGFLEHAYNSEGNLVYCSLNDYGYHWLSEEFSYVHRYDAAGKLIKITSCINGVENNFTITYGADGKAIKAVSEDFEMLFTYGKNGRLKSEVWKDAVEEDYILYSVSYDENGRVEKIEGCALALGSTFAYGENSVTVTDEQNAVYEISLKDGLATSGRAMYENELVGTMTWTYAENGKCANFIAKTDSGETEITFGYDALGLFISAEMTDKSYDNGVLDEKSVTTATYGDDGNCTGYDVREYSYDEEGKNPVLVNQEKYDGLGNWISK